MCTCTHTCIILNALIHVRVIFWYTMNRYPNALKITLSLSWNVYIPLNFLRVRRLQFYYRTKLTNRYISLRWIWEQRFLWRIMSWCLCTCNSFRRRNLRALQRNGLASKNTSGSPRPSNIIGIYSFFTDVFIYIYQEDCVSENRKPNDNTIRLIWPEKKIWKTRMAVWRYWLPSKNSCM